MKVTSKTEITITLPVNRIPELPRQVETVLPGGIRTTMNVVWDAIEPEQCAKPGSFRIQGTAEAVGYTNPWIPNRADPYVWKHTDELLIGCHGLPS